MEAPDTSLTACWEQTQQAAFAAGDAATAKDTATQLRLIITTIEHLEAARTILARAASILRTQ